MLQTIIDILNSDAVLAAIPTIGALLITWACKRSGRIERAIEIATKYSGTIISGIKQAEKAIPDGSENKALMRLDQALRYVVKVIERYEKRPVTSEEMGAIESAISEVHHEVTK